MDGIASISKDRQKIAELWREPFRVWFTGGKEDPGISLIAMQPQGAEYGDSKGWKKVSYLFKAAKAYVTGKKPEVSEGGEHGVLAP